MPITTWQIRPPIPDRVRETVACARRGFRSGLAVLGVLLGTAVALLGYVIAQGRRSVIPDDRVRAGHYDILVEADLADRAVRLLREDRPDAATPTVTRPS